MVSVKVRLSVRIYIFLKTMDFYKIWLVVSVYSDGTGNNLVLVDSVQRIPCFNMKPKSVFITFVEKLSSYKSMIRNKRYIFKPAVIFL